MSHGGGLPAMATRKARRIDADVSMPALGIRQYRAS
jgi:hypothetical protein